MSRIGRQPVPVPGNVKVSIAGNRIEVEGPKGKLGWDHHPSMTVRHDTEAAALRVTRPSDERKHRALHGLTRSLIANMVRGVSEGFQKRLEIVGVGYNARLQGTDLVLNMGFCHPVTMPAPEGIEVEVPAPTQIVIRGSDKQVVGQYAAEIRAVRKPEPYKGKGIRYEGEQVRRKAGKSFSSGAM